MLSSARKVLKDRDSRRKAGVPDPARLTGRPRTGNAAHRKASASNKLPVVEAVGAQRAVVEGVGAERSHFR